MTDAPHDTTATPGSTEWIKAHLARMDDSVEPASATTTSVSKAESRG